MKGLKTAYLVLLLLVACKKPSEDVVEVVSTPKDSLSSSFETSIYVLNEGLMQHNNASLTTVDLTTGVVDDKYFENLSGRKLGDVANDMLLHYPTLFVLINGSNTLEKIDIVTKKVQQLSVVNFITKKGSSPRQLYLSPTGDLYISCFDDNVVVVDTASLTIKKTLRVGKDPEGLIIHNNFLYVCNSGGLDFPKYDSTVSVIDVSTFKSVATITVGINPSSILADANGYLFVQSRGNYDKVDPALYVINTLDNSIVETLPISLNTYSQHGDSVFFFNSTTAHIDLFDLATRKVIQRNIIDASFIETLTSIVFDRQTSTFFLAESYDYTSSGKIYAVGTDDVIKYHFTTGLIPSKTIIYHLKTN